MKVKMITMSAGPEGSMHPGKTYDVNQEEGQALVDGEYATLVSEPKPQQPETDPINFDSITNIESFTELKADEQKEVLKHFEIEGDDSNGEKRVDLFADFLNPNPKDNQNAGDPNGSENSDGSGDGTSDASGGQRAPSARSR